MMIHDLSQDLYQLVRDWWTGDRIRASPIEGQIFRVGPGDLLTIDGVDLEVRQRGISDSSIVLVCETAIGLCELFITILDAAGICEVVWYRPGSQQIVDLTEIQIWERRGVDRERSLRTV